MSELLLTGISQVVTPFGHGPKRGAAMGQLRIIPEAAVAVDAGVISWIGPEREWRGSAESVIDLGGHAVVPGLVDPHTHAVWAGDRLADFEARSTGATYEEILAAGGGIWHTIRETAEKSSEEMAALALPRIEALQRSGATTIEVKSGYGYTLEAELRMLEAVRLLQERTQSRLVPTLLIHICPEGLAERETYREMVCKELIPEVARRRLASAVDIFVEHHAWSAEDARIVLACAQAAGLSIKLHTEQFQQVGGLELGVKMGALSVDHLEVCSVEQCGLVARSKTIATILPGVSLHLGLAAAPGRKLIDAGAAVAIGTDLNPGSSPLFSAAAAMGLAVRLNGLTAPEALTACTVNAAAALGLANVGRLEVGMQADLVVLESSDWRDLPYTLGQNIVREIWVAGRKQAA
ncbi:imidazolonepropionase [Tunturibacter empetritectus]|uniref:Imidazolonepropionase n=1 Tax=Tunturiibacter empetritectus TaxID=3069691 RepID=A0A7W8MT01_9BACT|nr:imidazolonepropionase [Edaphobacter lichenicola]MBB5319213.1 imidazolonepropionase [Edaphobacter lichenicola]